MSLRTTVTLVSSVLVAGMGLFLGVGLLLPSQLEVDASRMIDASPDEVWAQVGRLRPWARWSPWSARRDATIQIDYFGPESGFGARQRWRSEASGNGELRVVGFEAGHSVDFEVVFEGGAFALQGRVEVEPVSSGTRVRWHSVAELGTNPFNRYYAWMVRDTVQTSRRDALDDLNALVTGVPDPP